MTRIITFTGAQGTGKTSIRGELVRWLQNHEYVVMDKYRNIGSSISREASELGFKINEETNFETQYYIMHKYITAELETRKIAELNDVDFVVLDRSPLDVIAYTRVSAVISDAEKRLIEYTLLEHFNKFKTTLVYCEPLGFIDKDDHRSVDSSFQNRVVEEFEIMLYNLRHKYFNLPNVPIEERLRQILIQLKL